LLCAYAACLCLSISDKLFSHNALVSMVFVLVLTIPYEVLTYLFYFVIWGKGAGWYAILCKILPVTVYNSLFTLVMHPLVKFATYRE